MIRYQWSDVEGDIAVLINQIEDYLNSSDEQNCMIVGIHRGGLVPAVMLSHALDLPMKSLEWQTRDQGKNLNALELDRILFNRPTDSVVLFVDEIADSGETINSIQNHISEYISKYRLPVKSCFAVLVQRTACRLDVPVLSARTLDSNVWVHFPWEAD